MSGFFGSIMSSVQTDINTKSISERKTNTTSDISVSHDNLSNYNNFTYSWNIEGIDSTIVSSSNKITRITGKNIIGNTRLYCRVTNVTTGVTYTTPTCNINWFDILSASSTTASRVYNGTSQTVTVITGVNGAFSGSTSVSGTNVGNYTTTISGTGEYSGNVTGTLTITPITLTATGTNVSRTYNGAYQTVEVITGVNGTFSGSTISYRIDAGSYTTTISGTGNYSGNITGTLTIHQAAGFISLFAGDSYPAGYTSTVLFSRYLQSTNARYVFTSSVSGPGARDAYVQEGFGVESTSLATAGFVVTLTATINDPNYTSGSSTTTITFDAYTPPSGGGGTTYY